MVRMGRRFVKSKVSLKKIVWQLVAVIGTGIGTIQVVLCQINIFCQQLIQNTTTDFVTFTKIYTNSSEIRKSFVNLCESDKEVVVFWVNW